MGLDVLKHKDLLLVLSFVSATQLLGFTTLCTFRKSYIAIFIKFYSKIFGLNTNKILECILREINFSIVFIKSRGLQIIFIN